MKNYMLDLPPIISLENNFATNVNPLGPPEWVFSHIKNNSEELLSYPQLWHQECDKNVAIAFGINPDLHVTIPGTSQFFSSLPHFFCKEKCQNVPQKWASFSPTFWEYALTAQLNNIEFIEFPLDVDQENSLFCKKNFFNFLDKHKPDVLFLCTPNNPTGHVFSRCFVNELSSKHPEMSIVLDLTYSFFESNFQEYISLFAQKHSNIIVVISYSKFFCLPGLRIGSVFFSSADAAEKYKKLSGPLRLNVISERILPKLLRDKTYIDTTRKFFSQEWEFFIKKMKQLNLKWIKSSSATACFRIFFLKSPRGCSKLLGSSRFIAEKLHSNFGIRVCDAGFYGIENAIRIRVGKREANLRLLKALKELERLFSKN